MSCVSYIEETPSFYQLTANKTYHAVILSAPHGGTWLPDDFLAQSPLDHDALLETTDHFTDQLVLNQHIFPAISARFARSFVDLNRNRKHLDPCVVDEIPHQNNPYITAGYGVIPRFASRGKLTYRKKITLTHAEEMLTKYYDSYHQALAHLIDATKQKFNGVLLLDIHSAPKSALGAVDIQFGSCFGTSIRSNFYDALADIFKAQGWYIARETPFSGGHITSHYAEPKRNIETLQIEINRELLSDFNSSQGVDFQNKWQAALCAIDHLAKAYIEPLEPFEPLELPWRDCAQ